MYVSLFVISIYTNAPRTSPKDESLGRIPNALIPWSWHLSILDPILWKKRKKSLWGLIRYLILHWIFFLECISSANTLRLSSLLSLRWFGWKKNGKKKRNNTETKCRFMSLCFLDNELKSRYTGLPILSLPCIGEFADHVTSYVNLEEIERWRGGGASLESADRLID